jgi:hypothetical protein
VLRSERIEPFVRRTRRIGFIAFIPAVLGTGLGFLAARRSEIIGTFAFIVVGTSILVGGVATLVGFVLTIALFMSRTGSAK